MPTVAAVPREIEVTMPASSRQAAEALRDTPGILVVGGATIVMPALRSGALRPDRVMLLTRAGMDGIERDGDRVRVGATTTLSELTGMPEPLAGALAGVADGEIRGQATIAGNLCADPGRDAPRGDLQGPLIALAAVVHWTDGETEHRDPVEEFLAAPGRPRLVLAIELRRPRRGAFASLRRPHSHGYTTLAVSAAVGHDGELRLAATGLGSHGVRLRSAREPVPVAAEPAPATDAIASDWYRREMVPVLVRRCLRQLELGA
jgi:CO/xanthine dehydrogenase FAD-binding subunit